jgi:hypothetical protein
MACHFDHAIGAVMASSSWLARHKSRRKRKVMLILKEQNMTDPSPPPPREIYLSQTSDRDLFNRIASELARGLGGTWTAQINGLDQRYWDLAVEGQTITLHLEHYLGIMLLVEDADPDWIASERFQAVVRRLQTD